MRKKNGTLRTLFILSMVLKGIDGLLELAGGLAFVFLENRQIIDFISHLLHYNLFHIPNQAVLNWVTHLSQALTSNVKIFISVILICNGIIKIFLSVSLLLRKLLAFPLALAFLLILFVYQIVQTFYTPSLFLYLFNAIDAIVILVIGLEYRELKKEKGFH